MAWGDGVSLLMGLARLRRKLEGPLTNIHLGFSSWPVSLTSSTEEKGVNTTPSRAVGRKLLSWNGFTFAVKSSSCWSRP